MGLVEDGGVKKIAIWTFVLINHQMILEHVDNWSVMGLSSGFVWYAGMVD